MDGTSKDVAETRAYVASEAGTKAWMKRRRAGLSDRQNWAVSAVECGSGLRSGEGIVAIVSAILGRNDL